MLKALILLFTFLFLPSCGQEQEENISLEWGTMLYGSMPDGKQELFLDALKKEDVYFKLIKLAGHKTIVYKINETAKLRGVERKILYGEELNPNDEEGVFVSGDDEKSKYMAAFETKNIPFTVSASNSSSNEWVIYYTHQHGPTVDQIKQKLDMEKWGVQVKE